MPELAELRRVLRSALVSDALDALGRRQQCLGWDIRPLDETGVLVGHAFPCTASAVSEPSPSPYVGLLRALDAVGPGEVLVVATGRTGVGAVWGELLSTACAARGSVGAVTDGLVRDVDQVRRLGFPVHARGTVPYDSHGRYEITSVREPVIIDGVPIDPGALVVADVDGVVVVPAELESEVLRRVITKAEGESEFRRRVVAGMLPSRAFAETGVL